MLAPIYYIRAPANTVPVSNSHWHPIHSSGHLDLLILCDCPFISHQQPTLMVTSRTDKKDINNKMLIPNLPPNGPHLLSLIFLVHWPHLFLLFMESFLFPFFHHYRDVMGCYYTELHEINLRILWLYLGIILNNMFRITYIFLFLRMMRIKIVDDPTRDV
jgi:hypothetical protein